MRESSNPSGTTTTSPVAVLVGPVGLLASQGFVQRVSLALPAAVVASSSEPHGSSAGTWSSG